MASKSAKSKFLSLLPGSKCYWPSDRGGHHTCIIRDTLYLWGGHSKDIPNSHDSEKKIKNTSTIDVFHLHTGQWTKLDTIGRPPLGISGYACTSANKRLYFFGGDCGHENCYHNSLNELVTDTLTWNELSPTDLLNGPCRKTACAMVYCDSEEEEMLFVFGGYGIYPNSPQIGSLYTVDQANGLFRTNEQHFYSLTKNIWISPRFTGQVPSPCNTFTMTSISKQRAVVFGGRISNDHWDEIVDPLTHVAWPIGRRSHSASHFVGLGCDKQYIVVLGGEDCDNDHTKDCWILNVNEWTWKEVSLPDSVTERSFHSTSVFLFGPYSMWLVVIGGIDKDLITGPRAVMIIELENMWSSNVVLRSNDESLKCYQEKLFEQLKKGRADFAEVLTNLKPRSHRELSCTYHTHDVG